MPATGARAGRWAALATEGRNRRSRGLDALPTERAVALLLDEDRRALVAAGRARAKVARAARLAAGVLANGGDVVFLGAGTSGRLGVLEAAECPPTFGVPPRRIRAVMAGGRDAVFLGREGAEDDEAAGRAQGESLRAQDLLVGISASGVTPFVRGALAGARARGARTVLVTCAAGAQPRTADVVVAVPTGPEVLAGSTRLKAGSATKAVLNAITTAAMVRLGKVYEDLMVDVQPTSAKLADRSRRIVAAAAGVGPGQAARLLVAAGGEVKTAVVMARLGFPAEAARERLRRCGGLLRQALGPSRRRP
ncbi:MAG TPA: N-acetylmuramic acid 6-phosphate etherase [Vicinamibacteria bacterium]|nr:N-acetylmuramic acid 6-phosphate etherase [Vicinamibacteria bacterium]